MTTSANTVTFVSYANSGVPLGIYKYDENIVNNVIVAMGIYRYEFVDNDAYGDLASVPNTTSTQLTFSNTSLVPDSIFINTGNAVLSWLPDDTTVLVDDYDISDQIVSHSLTLRSDEDGEYQIVVRKSGYDDAVFTLTVIAT